MERSEKIRHWNGGQLRIFVVVREADLVGKNDAGEDLYMPRLSRRLVMHTKAVPFGDGFAMIPGESELANPNVLLRFEVRDDRPQCVAISSPPGGPELTTKLLREVNVRRQTREYLREQTFRLELDEKARVIGVPMFSPRDPWDVRTPEDIDKELGSAVRRTGRPPISEAELKRVAEIVEEAQRSEQPTANAVAEEFHLTLDAAKKRIQKARQRGLLPQVKPRRRSDG